MTPPATDSSTYARPDVVAYVAAVRARLDDLDPTEIEELTGGLEADLADLAAESDDPLAQRLGSPVAYADELRAAAGLGPRGQLGRTSVAENVRENLDDLLAGLRGHPSAPAVEGFLRAIRPAWWVLRAVLAVFLLVVVLGASGSFFALILLVAFAVVSVELGRGRWSGRRGLAPLVLTGNLLAAVVLPFAVGALISSTDRSVNGYSTYEGVGTMPGLSNDGQSVTNVFAFDAQGRPLTDVQLFDQDGQPLAVDPGQLGAIQQAADPVGVSHQPVPAVDAYGRQVWNAFPLRSAQVTTADDGSGEPYATAAPTPVAPPLVSVPPLAALPSVVPSATGSALPSASADPTAPTEAPTSSPTDEPTSSPTQAPTSAPTGEPTSAPTQAPTSGPSKARTTAPTDTPAPRLSR